MKQMRPETLDWNVANVLTGKSRRLPPCGDRGEYMVLCETFLSTSPDTYSLIAFCKSRYLEYFAQIYQSKTDTWSVTHLSGTARPIRRLRSPVYFDGILYMVSCNAEGCLVAYDQEARSWEGFKLITNDGCVDWGKSRLVICNSKLLLVVVLVEVVPHSRPRPRDILVLEVDPGSRQAFEVARGLPLSLKVDLCKLSCLDTVSHGNFIEVGLDKSNKEVLVYNMLEDEWNFSDSPRPNKHLRWCKEFQPGLNPSASVR